MTRADVFAIALVLTGSLAAPVPAASQGLRTDYARAQQFLPEEIRKLVYDGQVDPHWMAGTSRFWYQKEGPDGREFLMVDAAEGSRGAAFDHARLAAALT